MFGYRNKVQGKGCGQRIAQVALGVAKVCLPHHLYWVWLNPALNIMVFLKMSTLWIQSLGVNYCGSSVMRIGDMAIRESNDSLRNYGIFWTWTMQYISIYGLWMKRTNLAVTSKGQTVIKEFTGSISVSQLKSQHETKYIFIPQCYTVSIISTVADKVCSLKTLIRREFGLRTWCVPVTWGRTVDYFNLGWSQ